MPNEKPVLLLQPGDIKPSGSGMRVRGAFNPAAVRLRNGKIMLFVRVAETPWHKERYFLAPQMCGKEKCLMETEKIPRKSGKLSWEFFVTKTGLWRLPTLSHFREVLLDESGMVVEKISRKPDFFGIAGEGEFGLEDPRITFLEKEKLYAMTYVSVSRDSGVSTSLATTKKTPGWKRRGIIFRQQNKDVVLFPEKINGYYVAFHRPEGTMHFDKPMIWLSYSKDLIFWGRDKPIMAPRAHGWDSLRIGAGAVPVRTSEGFLEIYHGVGPAGAKNPKLKVYNAGAVLLDLKNPQKVIARTPCSEPLFRPVGKYERKGFRDNVVFPTAAIPAKNKKDLLVFSGAADENTNVRKIPVKKILNSMH